MKPSRERFELERDAARYRYMRDNPSAFNVDKGYFQWFLPRKGYGFMTLDEAIDYAIEWRNRK